MREGQNVRIKVRNPGILEVPEGKSVMDLPQSHFERLIRKQGWLPISRALVNLMVWNREKNPSLSEWADGMQEKLSEKFSVSASRKEFSMDLEKRLLRVARLVREGQKSFPARQQEKVADEAVLLIQDADELQRKFIKALGLHEPKSIHKVGNVVLRRRVKRDVFIKAMNVVEDAVKKSPGRGRHSGFSWKKWTINREGSDLEVLTSLKGKFSKVTLHISIGREAFMSVPYDELGYYLIESSKDFVKTPRANKRNIKIARYFQFTAVATQKAYADCHGLIIDKLAEL